MSTTDLDFDARRDLDPETRSALSSYHSTYSALNSREALQSREAALRSRGEERSNPSGAGAHPGNGDQRTLDRLQAVLDPRSVAQHAQQQVPCLSAQRGRATSARWTGCRRCWTPGQSPSMHSSRCPACPPNAAGRPAHAGQAAGGAGPPVSRPACTAAGALPSWPARQGDRRTLDRQAVLDPRSVAQHAQRPARSTRTALPGSWIAWQRRAGRCCRPSK